MWQPQMSPDVVWGQDRLRLRKASYNNLSCIRAVSTLLCHTFFFFVFFSASHLSFSFIFDVLVHRIFASLLPDLSFPLKFLVL